MRKTEPGSTLSPKPDCQDAFTLRVCHIQIVCCRPSPGFSALCQFFPSWTWSVSSALRLWADEQLQLLYRGCWVNKVSAVMLCWSGSGSCSGLVQFWKREGRWGCCSLQNWSGMAGWRVHVWLPGMPVWVAWLPVSAVVAGTHVHTRSSLAEHIRPKVEFTAHRLLKLLGVTVLIE